MNEDKKECGEPHPWQETVHCELEKGHEGDHRKVHPGVGASNWGVQVAQGPWKPMCPFKHPRYDTPCVKTEGHSYKCRTLSGRQWYPKGHADEASTPRAIPYNPDTVTIELAGEKMDVGGPAIGYVKAKPVASPTGGLKYDNGKVRHSLLPTDALREVAHVLTWACTRKNADGTVRYPPRNWERGLEYSRCVDALKRHLDAWWEGQEIDDHPTEGSGRHHLAGVVVNALFLLTFRLRGIGTDDRPVMVKKVNHAPKDV